MVGQTGPVPIAETEVQWPLHNSVIDFWVQTGCCGWFPYSSLIAALYSGWSIDALVYIHNAWNIP